MSLMTRIRDPMINDAQGTIIVSAVILVALGCLLLGLF